MGKSWISTTLARVRTSATKLLVNYVFSCLKYIVRGKLVEFFSVKLCTAVLLARDILKGRSSSVSNGEVCAAYSGLRYGKCFFKSKTNGFEWWFYV